MEDLRTVEAEEPKSGLQCFPRRTLRRVKGFTAQSLWLFLRVAAWVWACALGWVYVFQHNPKKLLLRGKLHRGVSPFFIAVCGVT